MNLEWRNGEKERKREIKEEWKKEGNMSKSLPVKYFEEFSGWPMELRFNKTSQRMVSTPPPPTPLPIRIFVIDCLPHDKR